MDDLAVGEVTIPASELRWRFSRSGGPGGQNVNRRATRAELLFDLTASEAVPGELRRRALRRLASRLDSAGVLRVVAEDARTQRANREAALARLRALLEDAFRPPPPPRKRTTPTAAARRRRVDEKRRRGEVKRARRSPAPERE